MSEPNALVNFVQSGGGKLIGMSLAYIASLLGMAFAWWNWKKRHPKSESKERKNEQ